jgi:putative membrane protein
MFATLVPGMKRGQASAIALQVGGFSGREGVLFVLPAVSMAFATLSIFVLGSTGRVRSSMAYDVQQIVGDLYFSQTVLFAGAVAIAACMSACILIILAKPIGRLLSRADGKYIKLFGFCVCSFLIVNFTGLYGVLMAFAATCIGLLSSRLGTRSVHLMGVLLVPSIVAALMA